MQCETARSETNPTITVVNSSVSANESPDACLSRNVQLINIKINSTLQTQVRLTTDILIYEEITLLWKLAIFIVFFAAWNNVRYLNKKQI